MVLNLEAMILFITVFSVLLIINGLLLLFSIKSNSIKTKVSKEQVFIETIEEKQQTEPLYDLPEYSKAV